MISLQYHLWSLLSGWWLTYPFEKYEFVSWADYSIPNWLESHKIHLWNHSPARYISIRYLYLSMVYKPTKMWAFPTFLEIQLFFFRTCTHSVIFFFGSTESQAGPPPGDGLKNCAVCFKPKTMGCPAVCVGGSSPWLGNSVVQFEVKRTIIVL